MNTLLWLDPDDDSTPFPPADAALRDPNGLLAVGGSLSPQRLEMAYRAGIFPWFSDGQPPLWWSPDPRAVFLPGEFHVSRSLRKHMRQQHFEVVFDRAFETVMRACAEPRAGQPGTWITGSMIAAYCELHRRGIAHSVEVYRDDRLVGGVYGVAFGAAFFGESMFSRESDGSKIALAWLSAQLARWRYHFIDCQVPSPHLARLGARLIPREQFLRMLAQALESDREPHRWRFESNLDPLAPTASASI